MNLQTDRIEVFIVIMDGSDRYYLLKVIRRGFDVYCIPPHLGMHFSLHESGESHFQSEGQAEEPRDELPIALVMGEAGMLAGKGIIRASLRELGRACGICSAIYPIGSLSQDYRKFYRSVENCFVIDKSLFSDDTSLIIIGVWAVPARNMISFEFNNPNIPENMLYKIVHCEPQIWIYACPC